MALSLADRLEIQDLHARYCQSVDAGDGAAWAECFTRGGVFVPGLERDARPITGRAALAAFASDPARAGARARVWNSHPVLIERDGIVESSCYGLLVDSRDGEPRVAASVVYRDELVREDGAWRFRSRRPVRDG